MSDGPFKTLINVFLSKHSAGEAAPPPHIYQNVDSISLFAESVTFSRSQRLKALGFFANYLVQCPRLSIDFLGRFCSL